MRARITKAAAAVVLANEAVVTALGQTTQLRAIGTAQQKVEGAAIEQTHRENFVNALQGRVAGVEDSRPASGKLGRHAPARRGGSSTAVAGR